MINIIVGAILGLLLGGCLVYWLRGQQTDIQVSLYVDIFGILLVGAIGACIGALRNSDNKKKKKTP